MSSKIGFVISPEVFKAARRSVYIEDDGPLNNFPFRADYGALNIVQKVWGTEYWLTNHKEYCSKILDVKAGFTSSSHYHKKKKETFIVLNGLCRLVLDGNNVGVTAGGQVTINPGVIHRFYVKKSNYRGCRILEVSTYHDDKDVVRLEESRALNYGE
jgi:mannose-6-phosphate isomerase-like protein (cupin superfamily)